MSESKSHELWQACFDGDHALVEVLLLGNDSAVEVNWIGPEKGDTPLHRACRFGHLQVVEILLKNSSVDVNAGNAGNASSPFYIACQEGHKDMVSLLLGDMRIDLNKPNVNCCTPFYIACQNGHREVVLLLLADTRIDVNTRHTKGLTPCFIACQNGHKAVVSLLLADMRIDANKPQNEWVTPFFIASENGHMEVVSLLLGDMRIEVNQQRNDGATPFYIVCQEGHKDMVSLLLADIRININIAENDQCTPLWMASQNGHLLVVQLILASGREIDTLTKSIPGTATWKNKTAAEVARHQGRRIKGGDEPEEVHTRKKQNGPLIAAWIDSFDRDPRTTCQQLRELPELRDSFISDLFALVIFLSDGLLTVVGAESSSLSSPTLNEAARFLRITQRLPIELQMVLCNHVFGASNDNVLTKHSEPAFKKLGKLLARTDSF